MDTKINPIVSECSKLANKSTILSTTAGER